MKKIIMYEDSDGNVHKIYNDCEKADAKSLMREFIEKHCIYGDRIDFDDFIEEMKNNKKMFIEVINKL